MGSAPPPTRAPVGRGRSWFPGLAVVAAGVAVYANMLATPFVFDDDTIVKQGRLHAFSPSVLIGTTRPLTDLTFAVNYAVGGSDPRGYHVVNLAVHLAAGLALLGLVRRTLLTPALRERYAAAASGLSLAVALVWLVHPLQTESVTYTIQRSESLAGLFLLLTLYAVVRASSSPRPRLWEVVAVASCALGMVSKPIMVTAPLVVLLYDRAFLTGSFAETWRRRRWLYAGLGATWVLLVLALSGPHESAATAGFAQRDVTVSDYARTQPQVVLHYLRLAFWPRPLVLDYGWPVAERAAVLLSTAAVAGLAILAVVAWVFRPALGFPAVAFFLLLAPSSSVVPIADLAFEHRMYLPLAALVVLVVVGADAGLRRLVPVAARRRALAAGAALAVVGALGLATVRRNQDYASPIVMWSTVVAERPDNHRAHNNLGHALFTAGRAEEAIAQYVTALRLSPTYPDAHSNLGQALVARGRVDEGIEHYREALRFRPDHASAHNNLGAILVDRGEYDGAIEHYRAALLAQPDYAEAHNNLGVALAKRRDYEGAVASYREALRLRPAYAEAHSNLGNVYATQGNPREAIPEYRAALLAMPESAAIHYNLGLALAATGAQADAVAEYESALRLNPSFPQAAASLAAARSRPSEPDGGGR